MLRLLPDMPDEFGVGAKVIMFPNVRGTVVSLRGDRRGVVDEGGTLHLVSVRALQERHEGG